jgi:hypothetical protein
MRIPSEDIPQADVLSEVVRTVDAVAAGARTFNDIADAIGKVDRQGRYYRRAAEILGFIHNEHNHSALTPSGRNLIAHPARRGELLADAVLKTRLMQRAIPFFEAHRRNGVRRQELTDFIEEVTEPVGPTMIPRRVSTVVGWLEGIAMIQERNGRYFPSERLPTGVNIVEYGAVEEPLLPKKYDLDEYRGVEGSVRKAKGLLNVMIDDAAKERAERAHQMLTDIVADRIRAAGAIPKNNLIVDLAATVRDHDFLFEMKSTTDSNVHSQVRRAISQLYEYRYLQQIPSAKLVVVIENPPPDEKKWLVDYVVKDRGLLIAWDGDERTLHCPPEIRRELSFLTG